MLPVTNIPLPDPSLAIDFANVVFRRQGKAILPGVSFTVRRGEHWAVLGANGAGKSTILSLCGGVTHPSSGTVHVLGHRIGRVDLQTLRRRIGHVNPRHPLQSNATITEVVLTGLTGSVETTHRWEPSAAEINRAHELIDLFGLAGKAGAGWLALSQGERGRTLIARALIANPELILLDEPSTGLDVAAREQLLETIDLMTSAQPEVTSLLVTHHLEELPTSVSHCLLLRHGEIVAAGPVEEVLTTANVTAAFEHPITVHHEDGRWGARALRRTSVTGITV